MDIHWTVHVANRKASWYEWQIALDIPEAKGTKLPRRNAAVTGQERNRLAIDDGPRSITGSSTSGREYQFRGKFLDAEVNLGEVRTEPQGRLLFLGGHGVSATPTGSPIFDPSNDYSFINANGWYDDICDGPVTATVNIEGRNIPVESAWVVTAPPNYAPSLVSVRTQYDELCSLFVQNRWLPAPTTVSFQNDVLPVLQRLSRLQWVNQGFAAQFGRGGPHDFEDASYIEKLAAPPSNGTDIYAELRR